jgi:hypothetical protein
MVLLVPVSNEQHSAEVPLAPSSQQQQQQQHPEPAAAAPAPTETANMTFTACPRSPPTQRKSGKSAESCDIVELKKQLNDLNQRHKQLHHVVMAIIGKTMPMHEVAAVITSAAEAHPRI